MRFALIAVTLLLGSCGLPGDNDTVYTEGMGNGRVVIFTDRETGCQYIVHNISGGITPRMNADGTQRCVPPEEQST